MPNRILTTLGLGLGALALVGGSATAASLITSSQIKDGTIQPVDLSATTRAKTVNRAPTYHSKTVETTGYNPSAYVNCPSGSTPVGGSYKVAGWDAPESVMVPVLNGIRTSSGVPVGWAVQFHSETSQALTIGVIVACVKK